ncbi:hypothetical protein LWI28_008330 [Acer negundo]|uniref:RNase H type-1 domain-containing protein n=1 Tax=Acer negundo TaxID=4023 RepID=A0AAD5JA81_ACENE|nr:hypothetical protein LWI28_008330 [Acer negundo]
MIQLIICTRVATRQNSKSIAFGSAIKDDKGRVIMDRSRTMGGSFSPNTGKFLAFRESLLLAKIYNITVKTAEMDSPNIASNLNSSSSFLRDVSFIVNDMKCAGIHIIFNACQIVALFDRVLDEREN